MPRAKNHTNTILTVMALIALALLVWLMIPNRTVVVLACLVAHFAHPMYRWIHRRIPKSSGIALFLTWIGIIGLIIVPVILAGSLLISEATTIYQDLINEETLDQAEQRIQTNVSDDMLNDIDKYLNTNTEKIRNTVLNSVKNIATSAGKWTASIFGIFTSIILFAFVVSALITQKKSLTDEIKDIIPMDDRIVDTYLERLALMSRSLITSTFVIALIQGIISGLSYRIAGVPYPIFFTFLACLLAIIPMVGAGIVSFPIGMIMIATGNIGGGIFIIAMNLIVVGNIDNILRPRLVDKKAQINDTLFILALFGGMSYRGMMGMLYGPLLMSFVLTTIEIAKEKKILH